MLILMIRMPGEETIPYHFLFLSLTIVYGFRVWPMVPTIVVILVVTVSTGAIMFLHYLQGFIDEPELVGPVTAYMLVISAMVACAIGAGHPIGILGAVLFYASDSLIAWNRLVSPDQSGPTSRPRLAIITTYHVAQLGFVLSLI